MGMQGAGSCLPPGREPSLEPARAGPNPGPLACRTEKNKFLLFTNHPVKESKQTKAPGSSPYLKVFNLITSTKFLSPCKETAQVPELCKCGGGHDSAHRTG